MKVQCLAQGHTQYPGESPNPVSSLLVASRTGVIFEYVLRISLVKIVAAILDFYEGVEWLPSLIFSKRLNDGHNKAVGRGWSNRNYISFYLSLPPPPPHPHLLSTLTLHKRWPVKNDHALVVQSYKTPAP